MKNSESTHSYHNPPTPAPYPVPPPAFLSLSHEWSQWDWEWDSASCYKTLQRSLFLLHIAALLFLTVCIHPHLHQADIIIIILTDQSPWFRFGTNSEDKNLCVAASTLVWGDCIGISMSTTVERSPCSLLHHLLPRLEFRVWSWFLPWATSAGDADCFRHSQIIYRYNNKGFIYVQKVFGLHLLLRYSSVRLHCFIMFCFVWIWVLIPEHVQLLYTCRPVLGQIFENIIYLSTALCVCARAPCLLSLNVFLFSSSPLRAVFVFSLQSLCASEIEPLHR